MRGIRMLRPYRGLRGGATQYARVLAKTGQTALPLSRFYRFPKIAARFPSSGGVRVFNPGFSMLSTSNLSAAQAETYYTHEDYYSAEEKSSSDPSGWAKGLRRWLEWVRCSQSAGLQPVCLPGRLQMGQSLTGKVQ
jgi:hypothetical protein